MKWQLVTLGLSWGYFLFKLYQQLLLIIQIRQYKSCKKLYENDHLLIKEKQNPQPENIIYDSEKNAIVKCVQPNQYNTPGSAVEIPIRKENSLNLIKQQNKVNQKSQNLKKMERSFQTTIDQSQFVVFPQLYPHLRKKKMLSKKHLTNRQGQKRRIRRLRNRNTKQYKQWFITNKILTQIQQSGHLTTQQIQSNYAKITKQIKNTCIQGPNTKSDSIRSQEGTNLENGGQIIIKKDQNKKGKQIQNQKILAFLEDQFINPNQKMFEIKKYDPFA